MHRLALTHHAGSGAMAADDEHFAVNGGIARVLAGDEGDTPEQVAIPLARLDDLADGSFGVLKLDGEGHELKARIGADALLRRGARRNLRGAPWDPPVLVATTDANRLRARFGRPGWRALRGRGARSRRAAASGWRQHLVAHITP